MAARTRRVRHDDATRERIRTSMIINRLQKSIEGKVDLSSPQVTAALGLLKKTLPDLSSVEMGGKGGGPIIIQYSKSDEGLL